MTAPGSSAAASQGTVANLGTGTANWNDATITWPKSVVGDTRLTARYVLTVQHPVTGRHDLREPVANAMGERGSDMNIVESDQMGPGVFIPLRSCVAPDGTPLRANEQPRHRTSF